MVGGEGGTASNRNLLSLFLAHVRQPAQHVMLKFGHHPVEQTGGPFKPDFGLSGVVPNWTEKFGNRPHVPSN